MALSEFSNRYLQISTINSNLLINRFLSFLFIVALSKIFPCCFLTNTCKLQKYVQLGIHIIVHIAVSGRTGTKFGGLWVFSIKGAFKAKQMFISEVVKIQWKTMYLLLTYSWLSDAASVEKIYLWSSEILVNSSVFS